MVVYVLLMILNTGITFYINTMIMIKLITCLGVLNYVILTTYRGNKGDVPQIKTY